MTSMFETLEKDQEQNVNRRTQKFFKALIQPEQYVGEVYSIGYETALAQIHDFDRQRVGGIPSLSFLIATRVDPNDSDVDYKEEDTSIILLRVMDAAPLPNDAEALRLRVDAARQTETNPNDHWDSKMDGSTANLLSYAGVRCRVIGTFFVDHKQDEETGDVEKALALRFGSDISNYYPNKGLKVYKPNDEALKAIVNYRN